jgi:hypothetical protein
MRKRNKSIPINEQANVPGGLMSFDLGTVPGKRPPNFGKQHYQRLDFAPGRRALTFDEAIA